MADYKTMYYHMAGRVAGAVDALEASNARRLRPQAPPSRRLCKH